METVYGAGLDPVPYIIGAYTLGLVGILGMMVSITNQRLRLRRQLAVIRATK